MASFTQAEVRALLLQHLPRGADKLYDLSTSSNVGKIWSAISDAVKRYGFDMIDTLRAEIFPASANAKLAEWGKLLKLTQFLAWRNGTEAQRSVVIARLRESGSYTLPNIRAVVGPLLGYADPNDVEILETPRADLTTANSYTNSTAVSIVGGGSANRSVTVADDPRVSEAGARLKIVGFAASNLSDVTVTLTGPDSTVKTWTGEKYFRGSPTPMTLFAIEFAGLEINGTWTVGVSSAAGNVSWTSVAVQVEGIGWQSTPWAAEGLGAEIFRWAVQIDPALEGIASPSDRQAVVATIVRLKPAHTQPFLVLKTSGGGACSIWGDGNALWDMGTWC